MKVLVPALYERMLAEADPFAGDAFARKSLATNLTRLLRISDDGLVLTIEAPWGMGKTTFLRMWEKVLATEDDFVPVYYNAFRYDFTRDPFVSIAAAIYSALQSRVAPGSRRRATEAQLAHLKKASKSLAVDLIKMAADISLGSLLGGMFSRPLLEWVKQAFRKLSFATLEVNADEKFDAYLRSEDSIQTYQNALRFLLESDTDRQRVVVFVDELDRCRPIFAVELIEKIKHLFNIPDVHFVLGLNADQLIATIKSVYGIPEDQASIYLQKFVDFSVRLRTASPGLSQPQLQQMMVNVLELLGLDDGPRDVRPHLPALSELSGQSMLDISPRGIERIFSLISLSLHGCNDEAAERLRPHICIAATIRVGRPSYYEKLSEKGQFFEYSNDDRRVFRWARDHFGSSREDLSGNIFKVSGMEEALRVVDLYHIPRPEESDDESVSTSQP